MTESEIFLQARILNGQDRERFIANACQGNKELREQVEALLDVDLGAETAENLLDTVELHSGQLVGDYRLLEIIGSGGFGTVWKATDSSNSGRFFAIKFIRVDKESKELRSRFLSEGETLKTLSHPNVTKLIDTGMTPCGRPYFVMEYIQGTNISQYCKQNKVGLHGRLQLMLEICRGVHHANQNGIVHRDLKPGNVLIETESEPTAKLIDFGVSKNFDSLSESAQTALTVTGQIIGSVEYMSPEQASFGIQPVTASSDVFSLGVILYELVTGKIPFRKEIAGQPDPLATIESLQQEDPTFPSRSIKEVDDPFLQEIRLKRFELSNQLSSDLDWIILKALQKKPQDRYHSAEALAEDIERFLAKEPVLATSESLLIRGRRVSNEFSARKLSRWPGRVKNALVNNIYKSRLGFWTTIAAVLLILSVAHWISCLPPSYRISLKRLHEESKVSLLREFVSKVEIEESGLNSQNYENEVSTLAKFIGLPSNADAQSAKDLYRSVKTPNVPTTNGIVFELEKELDSRRLQKLRQMGLPARTSSLRDLVARKRTIRLNDKIIELATQSGINKLLVDKGLPACPKSPGAWRSLWCDLEHPANQDATRWSKAVSEAYHQDLSALSSWYQRVRNLEKAGQRWDENRFRLVSLESADQPMEFSETAAQWDTSLLLEFRKRFPKTLTAQPKKPVKADVPPRGSAANERVSVVDFGLSIFDLEFNRDQEIFESLNDSTQIDVVRDTLLSTLKRYGLGEEIGINSPTAKAFRTGSSFHVAIEFNTYSKTFPEVSEAVSIDSRDISNISQLRTQVAGFKSQLRERVTQRLFEFQLTKHGIEFRNDESGFRCKLQGKKAFDLRGRVNDDCSIHFDTLPDLTGLSQITESVFQSKQTESLRKLSGLFQLTQIRLDYASGFKLSGNYRYDGPKNLLDVMEIPFVISVGTEWKVSTRLSRQQLDDLTQFIKFTPEVPGLTREQFVDLLDKGLKKVVPKFSHKVKITTPSLINGTVTTRVFLDLGELNALDLGMLTVKSASEIEREIRVLFGPSNFNERFAQQYSGGFRHPTLGKLIAMLLAWDPRTGELDIELRPDWPGDSLGKTNLTRSMAWTQRSRVQNGELLQLGATTILDALNSNIENLERQFNSMVMNFSNGVISLSVRRNKDAFGKHGWLRLAPLGVGMNINLEVYGFSTLAGEFIWDQDGFYLQSLSEELPLTIPLPHFALSDPTIKIELPREVSDNLLLGQFEDIARAKILVGGRITPPTLPVGTMLHVPVRKFGFFRADNPWLHVLAGRGLFGGSVGDQSLNVDLTLELLEEDFCKADAGWNLKKESIVAESRIGAHSNGIHQGLVWDSQKLQTDVMLNAFNFEIQSQLLFTKQNPERPFFLAGRVGSTILRLIGLGDATLEGSVDYALKDPELKTEVPFGKKLWHLTFNSTYPYLHVRSSLLMENGEYFENVIPPDASEELVHEFEERNLEILESEWTPISAGEDELELFQSLELASIKHVDRPNIEAITEPLTAMKDEIRKSTVAQTTQPRHEASEDSNIKSRVRRLPSSLRIERKDGDFQFINDDTNQEVIHFDNDSGDDYDLDHCEFWWYYNSHDEFCMLIFCHLHGTVYSTVCRNGKLDELTNQTYRFVQGQAPWQFPWNDVSDTQVAQSQAMQCAITYAYQEIEKGLELEVFAGFDGGYYYLTTTANEYESIGCVVRQGFDAVKSVFLHEHLDRSTMQRDAILPIQNASYASLPRVCYFVSRNMVQPENPLSMDFLVARDKNNGRDLYQLRENGQIALHSRVHLLDHYEGFFQDRVQTRRLLDVVENYPSINEAYLGGEGLVVVGQGQMTIAPNFSSDTATVTRKMFVDWDTPSQRFLPTELINSHNRRGRSLKWLAKIAASDFDELRNKLKASGKKNPWDVAPMGLLFDLGKSHTEKEQQ